MLVNGKKITLEVDPEQSASDLKNKIEEIAPIDESFELVFGFPPKRISASFKSLRELGLINCSVTQKLIPK